MLILLGGYIGSGRKALAQKLAALYNVHNYDMKQHKFRSHEFNKKREVVETIHHIHRDEERLRIYRQCAQDLPLLSKMYQHVVVERTFHRKKPREFLLAEAKKSFDIVIFVWVDADETLVRGRLEAMQQARLIESVEKALAEREEAKKEFEPFDVPPLMFTYTGEPEESARKLWALIQDDTSLLNTKSLSGT